MHWVQECGLGIIRSQLVPVARSQRRHDPLQRGLVSSDTDARNTVVFQILTSFLQQRRKPSLRHMDAVTFLAETSPVRSPPRVLFLAFETAVGKRLITDPTATAHRLVMKPEARIAHHRLSGTGALPERTCPCVNPVSFRVAIFASVRSLASESRW